MYKLYQLIFGTGPCFEPMRPSSGGSFDIIVTISKIKAFINLKAMHSSKNQALTHDHRHSANLKYISPAETVSPTILHVLNKMHTYFSTLHNKHGVTCVDDK
jgi:hypothetical protein